jgi:hypothetical protein
LAFLAVYCSTSLPPGVLSFRVTLDRVQYECLPTARDDAQTSAARRLARRRSKQRCRSGARSRNPKSQGRAPAAERDALHHDAGAGTRSAKARCEKDDATRHAARTRRRDRLCHQLGP